MAQEMIDVSSNVRTVRTRKITRWGKLQCSVSGLEESVEGHRSRKAVSAILSAKNGLLVCRVFLSAISYQHPNLVRRGLVTIIGSISSSMHGQDQGLQGQESDRCSLASRVIR